jgi:hypothetical protein
MQRASRHDPTSSAARELSGASQSEGPARLASETTQSADRASFCPPSSDRTSLRPVSDRVPSGLSEQLRV